MSPQPENGERGFCISGPIKTDNSRHSRYQIRAAMDCGTNGAGKLGFAMEAGMTCIYVSPAGSDLNTGLSPDQPIRTIQRAIDIISCLDLKDVVELADPLAMPEI